MVASYSAIFNEYRQRREGLDRLAFYQLVRNEGVGVAFAAALLRDLYNCNLAECMEVMHQCGDGQSAALNEP
jgi:hypothetical protein